MIHEKRVWVCDVGWPGRGELVRPTVFDAERCDIILKLVSKGMRISQALRAVGISHESFRIWENRYRANVPDIPQEIVDFFGKLSQAEVFAEFAAVQDVIAGRPGWQGPAWFLERRYPQRWGKRDRSPVPLSKKDLTKLSDEEFDRYRRELEGEGT